MCCDAEEFVVWGRAEVESEKARGPSSRFARSPQSIIAGRKQFIPISSQHEHIPADTQITHSSPTSPFTQHFCPSTFSSIPIVPNHSTHTSDESSIQWTETDTPLGITQIRIQFLDSLFCVAYRYPTVYDGWTGVRVQDFRVSLIPVDNESEVFGS